MTDSSSVRLTQYSHGAGCGCKISPALLDDMLASTLTPTRPDARLIVGNDSRDDAAVYDLGDGSAVISTTDFFMPIVDDPFTFGRIAATNAISDVYAMGGQPMLAIAILGWPIDKLGPDVAAAVIDGGRSACLDAGITLAGGHSIDAPEPIFGLAVTGRVELDRLKRNDTARAGDRLFLTKPLGVGVLSTAQKNDVLRAEHAELAPESMMRLNRIGRDLAAIEAVTAMTDVTGFGLGGHLLELCRGSRLHATIDVSALPLIESVADYINAGQMPGGTGRNFASYGRDLGEMSAFARAVVCDPQTSGGLLVAVRPEAADDVAALLAEAGLHAAPIGTMVAEAEGPRVVFDEGSSS
ncbi:selenide, water dikinase SelD [Guyparkeria hydrothermalis]|uniref:selenide, water dikinase SelD n=1 Tax=Guyparkeria hydrothermalis TaxID=923 RepID=UPI0020206FFE|nr:selenide, water dikinase SelD [Guyparkeria hydrothermalis]MCL7744956.1 selenide, water dikinase SelD [Guyparkeria hydrothermalis]